MARDGETLAGASTDDVLAALLARLGGPSAVVEQLTTLLSADDQSHGVTEDTEGYCYLRLFDSVEHRDAIELGPCPTVAAIRRFSNGRADPFGTRGVVVKIHSHNGQRVGHISYDSGSGSLRPVAALAALAKDLRVGLPDGVSETFPPDWVPHDKQIVQTWDFIMGGTIRNLDLLSWVGASPPWLDTRAYETISHPSSRVGWVLRANPLGPPSAMIDVIDDRGKVSTVRQWSSYIAHAGYHQKWRVRGAKVFAEVYIWRAAKVLSDPTAPAPIPTPAPSPNSPDGHGDLLTSRWAREAAGKPWARCGRVLIAPTFPAAGHCYSLAFAEPHAAVTELGPYPTVAEVLACPVGRKKAWVTTDATCVRDGFNVHHVVDRPGAGLVDFWATIESMNPIALLGATQDTVHGSGIESVSAPPTLTLRPRSAGMVLNVPFIAILSAGKERMMWDITAGKKLEALVSYYESVELVSLKASVTVHQGDGDTLVTVVADTFNTRLVDEEDWVGAAHTLHVSGNTNGATSGEFVLEGSHGFGTQLKGLALGNPTPVVQAKLETSVAATAYIKFMLRLRVSGTGIPRAIALPTYAVKGG